MRFLYALGIIVALGGPAAAATLSDAAITGVPGWNVSQTGTPPNSQVAALAADPSEKGHLPRPKATKLLLLNKNGGEDRAAVLYLDYATDKEAKRALNLLRQRLLGTETQTGGPRLLRATNVVAIVDARTLSVTMTVSQQLGTVGSVQDGADASDFEDVGGNSDPGMPKQQQDEDSGGEEPLMGTVPQVGSVQAASDPALQAQVGEGLGRYLQISTEAGQLLQNKQYHEALVAYRRYARQVEADKGAQPMAQWDALSGVGLAAAYSGQMAEARKAFQRAVAPAARLDARKLAETMFNLACAEAELGQKPAALAALRGCMAAAKQAGPDSVSHYRQSIRSDHSLRSLQGAPQLRQILAGR